MSRTDRAIGISLGLLIGVVAVVVFVFAGGGGIDEASLEGDGTAIESQQPADSAPDPGTEGGSNRGSGSNPLPGEGG